MQFFSGRFGTDFFSCQACWYGVETVNSMVSNEQTLNQIENGCISACSAFLS